MKVRPGEKSSLLKKILMDFIAERVPVTGRMVEKGGVKLLLISKVVKAK